MLGRELLRLALIRFEQRLPKRLDRLVYRRRVGGIGKRGGAPQQARRSNCERAGSSQTSAGDLLGFLPGSG